MQSQAEKRREAYLHQLKSHGQLKAYDFKEKEMVPIHDPHLVENDGRWSVQGYHNGHMVSKFVKPPC